jgi:hypothetical protein
MKGKPMRENQTANPNDGDYCPETLPELSEETKQWLALRKEAGLKIDPETCELLWVFAQTLDPYGVYDPAKLEAAGCSQVGREYFARSSESDGWVHYLDLPDATEKILWEKRGTEWPPSLYAKTDKEGRITLTPTIDWGVRADDPLE